MEIERALQQLELLQKKLYAYHCAGQLPLSGRRDHRAQRYLRGQGAWP